MKTFRILLAAVLISPAAAFAASDEWAALDHALTLVQTFVRISAHSDNPAQGFDDVLAGRNSEANRALSGLLEEFELPPRHKDKLASIGRDLATLARKSSPVGLPYATSGIEGALQARRELHAMGLTYYDEKQYREAVKRGDKIAVDLFVAAQGLPSLRNPPVVR